VSCLLMLVGKQPEYNFPMNVYPSGALADKGALSRHEYFLFGGLSKRPHQIAVFSITPTVKT
jgi:hypothetical protein